MIEVKNLYKIYNQHKKNEFIALNNINFLINKEEIVLLKGVSGSGKSTLLSIISSLQKPTSGDIIVDKEHVAKLPDLHASNFRNKKIGYVFQDFNLINSLNVYQNIMISLIPQNLNNKQLDEKILNVLDIANIKHKKDELVSNLSGGEKQRVAIARALVCDADILLFDEPTANLDKQNSLKFLKILQIFKKLSKTVIIATHDSIFEQSNLITKIIYMENGQIL
ncbi:ABC transporter ATP-binding protein [Malaciobacter molluscorum LMG 25693]|uniref:ABC transporter ATP-binding protein n=1 Tax=Malaciobacter molluscorum LMG 25693 TaxID=870501 RepID=A0A2G1DGP5_9BACT|nr:ABC transporter ATP-binding protein [Malaciobacter molluscorum]AXX92521.1 ABC transporter, ATP-binding protein, FtsE/LolD family [Malaciobacter molluscorum LMG 25693]PHO17610.1 ABC transporter ATP-binding protein [Malaciobacter molluscorum LMG 25693]